MASDTANFGLRKDGRDDYYNIDVVNANLDKIDSALQKIKKAAENKDGGNADTVDGKHGADFTGAFIIESFDELAKTDKTGMFGTKNNEYSGLSLYIGLESYPDSASDRYVRIYSDHNGGLYVRYDECNTMVGWVKGNEVLLNGFIDFSRIPVGTSDNTVARGKHNHTVKDITDFPESVKANGGNADTVDGKHASDLASVNHTHTKSQITDFPASLPANGGNADTVDGKHASDLASVNHTHTKSQITDFPASLPANGGSAEYAQFIKTYSKTNGYNTNNYGNFVHNGTYTGDSWCITDKDVNPTFKVYYESGNVTANGTITADSFCINGTGMNSFIINYGVVSDIYDYVNTGKSCVVSWNANTLNSPLKAGVVGAHTGTIYINSSNSNYTTLTAYPDGSNEICYKAIGGGADKITLYEWEKTDDRGGWGFKKKVSFTAASGNWYRIITRTDDYCGGVFTLAGGMPNARSTTVFSASQCFNYAASADAATDKLVKLSHSVFHGFISKIRMVYGTNGEVFIDCYVNNGTGTAELTIIFNGTGWKASDTVKIVNTAGGTVYKEITL